MAQAQQQDPRSTFESFGRKVDERVGNIAPRMEEEVQRVIAYLNDIVVPQVRRNSSSALRAAAEQLGKLAEHLEQNSPAAQQPSAPPAGETRGA